jgi:hypothetical protein
VKTNRVVEWSGHYVLACALVVAMSCGKKEEEKAPEVPIDVAAVNALVPESLRDKLVFEQQDIVEERGKSKTIYTVAAPRGWKPGMKGFATVKPEEHDLGFFTELSVGTNCDGFCEAKDWAAVVEKVHKSAISGEIIKDDKRPGGRTIVGKSNDGKTTTVLVASWKEGDRRYAKCEARLEEALAAAAPAFEKACERVRVREE